MQRNLGVLGGAMLLWPALASAAGSAAKAGTELTAVIEAPEMTVDEFVAQNTVAPKAAATLLATAQPKKKAETAKPAPTPSAAPKAHGEGKVLVQHDLKELVDSEEMTVGALLEPMVATTLPSKTKQELAVQVIIPDGPVEDEDITARLVKPTGPVSQKRAADITASPEEELAAALEQGARDAVAASAPKAPVGNTASVGDIKIVATPSTPAPANTATVGDIKIVATKERAPVPASNPVAVAEAAKRALAAATNAKVVAAQARASAAQAKGDNKLVVTETPKGLAFLPQTLTLAKAGAKADIDFLVQNAASLAVFVRDAHILSFDREAGNVTALRTGKTEIYVVHGGKMYILPVTVDRENPQLDLKIPDALVSLDGFLPANTLAGSLPASDLLAAASPQLSTPRELTDADGPSLNDSLADTARTAADAEKELRRYAASHDATEYGNLTVQVVDDRSSGSAVYPAPGVNVHILGTQFAARADSTGHLTIRDVPLRSRFWVTVSDPSGHLAPTMAEVSMGAGRKGVVRIRGMRQFGLDTFGNIAGQAQDANHASLCGTVTDKEDGGVAEGVSVAVDVNATGPFYFNQYGFLDMTLRGTGRDGRFCYLNVTPGPVALTMSEGEAVIATLPTATFAGLHAEIDVTIGDEKVLQTRLATLPTAHEQLGGDQRAANALKTIDMVDMIPLGEDRPMMQVGPGIVATAEPVLGQAGRAFALVQASEFEPVVYSYGLDRKDHVTPLLPRGFIDDMSLYAQVSHDPALGSVVVEYGGKERGDNGSVNVRLVDQFGNDVGNAWYYADDPTTKAVFFNVPAGAYALMVQTADEAWLGADTVVVYNETVSYLRLGSRLSYKP